MHLENSQYTHIILKTNAKVGLSLVLYFIFSLNNCKHSQGFSYRLRCWFSKGTCCPLGDIFGFADFFTRSDAGGGAGGGGARISP